jgi:Mesyanzhinovviridae DNA helicase
VTYSPRLPLRAHQQAARELTRGKKVWAYLCEMGTGKSAMVLVEWADRVEAGTCHDLLIVAPAGSYLNWCIDKSEEQVSEIRKHLAPDLFKRTLVGVWQSGASKTSQARLKYVLDQGMSPEYASRPRVMVINIEALSRVDSAIDACIRFLSAPGRRSMLVVDESTTIRNGDTKRTKTILDLGRLANMRRILTGLVTPRSPMDLFSQFEFLDIRILGYSSIYAFRHRYCVMNKIWAPGTKPDKDGNIKPRQVDVIVAFKNEKELNEKIAPYSYRVLKEDCLDLPPKIYQRREVELTNEQSRVYKELVAFANAELDNNAHVTATMVMTRLLRLHQIVCGHTVDEVGVEHDIKSNRISSMMELLEEHSGKVIIWSNYRREVQKIVEALEEEYGTGSVAQFHGGNKSTRSDQERSFLADPICRFMVSTQSAGGRGNTWVNANLVIYFSNNHDLEMRMQSEDRCHRDGLKHSVTYVDLVAPNTIDEKILKALRKKLNMATLISGEGYREWLI